MPSPITYLKKDPNYNRGPEKYRVKINRGPGEYYHRGKGWYSKYDPKRDAKIKAKGYKISNTGLPKNSPIRHAGDGYLSR
jgi:hypothetical protein